MKLTTGKHKILIVDDMPTNINILSEALRGEYRLSVATNGAKGLEIANSEDPPDLVLLDIKMPEMDGYEVLSRLKRSHRTRNIPVIFVTAKGQLDEEIRGLAMGAVDYITKPFYVHIVKARVHTHVQLKVRTDMLEQLAMIDGLTGVANRLNFDQAFEREWKRAARSRQAVSVIMMDIDHFKVYNDNYGHGTGDRALQSVSNALGSVIKRPSDLISRYGGTKFAALLPDTDSVGAAWLAECFRRAVIDLALPHEYSPVVQHVSISVGHATRTANPEHLSQQLLEAADMALLKAKEAGRNLTWEG